MTVESIHMGNVSTLFALERGQLLNRLNVIHFQDGCLFAVLRHKDHDHTLRLQATPYPAEDEHIRATWHKDAVLPPSLQAFTLESIIIPGPKRTFSFLPERYWIDSYAIRFELPDGATEIVGRDMFALTADNHRLMIPFACRSEKTAWHYPLSHKTAGLFETCLSGLPEMAGRACTYDWMGIA